MAPVNRLVAIGLSIHIFDRLDYILYQSTGIVKGFSQENIKNQNFFMRSIPK
jgi:hypothetical protein